MEDVFESIFLLRKEHILPLLEFIWADLLTEEEEEEVVEIDIAEVVIVEIVMVEAEVEDVMAVEAAAVTDADDHLLHTIEAAAVVAEGIIVQDPDLIHPVDIERGQTGDVVEIFKKNI